MNKCIYCKKTTLPVEGRQQPIDISTTKDHLFSASFWHARPTDLITVPSCFKCNQYFSMSENYFRTHIVGQYDFLEEKNIIEKHLIADLIMRTRVRDQLVKEKDISKLMDFFPNGNVVEENPEKTPTVLKKYIYGICFLNKIETPPFSETRLDYVNLTAACIEQNNICKDQFIVNLVKRISESKYQIKTKDNVIKFRFERTQESISVMFSFYECVHYLGLFGL